ncbi:MAG: DUF2490 domain-containing protein [Chitinophagales bacterium]|jgi:hypothetical protein|nr:DUF2490 domain-containing protein [Sphingobacteriales bacterium]
MKKTFYWVFFFLSFTLVGQSSDLGSWNILNVKYNYDDKWSGFAEAQLRSLKFYDHFHYYEIKGGINYKAFSNVKFTLGAGSYQTYREGGNFVTPKNNDEFRLWPQVILTQTVGLIKIEQRYRMEMRFTSNGYRNRFRYRVGFGFPFGNETKGYQPYQVAVNNELFFTDNEPYFERNRLLFAFNYKPSKNSTIQIGYLYQFDYRIKDEIGRDFLQIGYFVEIFRNKSSSKTIDTDTKDN